MLCTPLLAPLLFVCIYSQSSLPPSHPLFWHYSLFNPLSASVGLNCRCVSGGVVTAPRLIQQDPNIRGMHINYPHWHVVKFGDKVFYFKIFDTFILAIFKANHSWRSLDSGFFRPLQTYQPMWLKRSAHYELLSFPLSNINWTPKYQSHKHTE